MTTYDQKKQKVDTQYNANRDIVIVNPRDGKQALRKDTQIELTKEEKELLVSAYEYEGRFILFDKIQQSPRWVRAGTKDFLDESETGNYIYSEKYWKAFQSLRQRGYVDHESRQLYTLNYDGIQKAEELVKAVKSES